MDFLIFFLIIINDNSTLGFQYSFQAFGFQVSNHIFWIIGHSMLKKNIPKRSSFGVILRGPCDFNRQYFEPFFKTIFELV